MAGGRDLLFAARGAKNNMTVSEGEMMTREGLDSTIEQIRASAQEAKSYVVETLPESDRQDGYRVALSLDGFVELIKHIKPRILYLHASTFNARQDSLAILLPGLESSEDTQHEMLNRQEVVNLVKRFKQHDGGHDTFIATFVVDGILHSLYERASWFEEFQSEAGDLQARYEAVQDEEDERSEEMDRKKVREYATKLCENPKFNEGRPSREKRTYLAQSLFSDLTEDEICEVVDEATNLGWLKA